jgi:hypothetical protein
MLDFKVQHVCPLLALFGPHEMSDLSPECAPKRTSGLAERGFILRQANSANEKAAGHCAQRPTGLKINWL